ncbi:hypothetical protein BsIDN1_61470 [Bacillus safensis]|uniref:Uncharacterized protein n=1 Tax=Bacillus safensis TaxID=561879 RepID=A0A5S9MKW4_BACIA|nr:hypothetical protein BsIDN1_61470 [Bacillus safensis]
MLRWIVSILVNALLLIVIAGYFDSGILPGLGSVYIEGFGAAIVAKYHFVLAQYFSEAVFDHFNASSDRSFTRIVLICHQCDYTHDDIELYGR